MPSKQQILLPGESACEVAVLRVALQTSGAAIHTEAAVLLYHLHQGLLAAAGLRGAQSRQAQYLQTTGPADSTVTQAALPRRMGMYDWCAKCSAHNAASTRQRGAHLQLWEHAECRLQNRGQV